MPRTACRAHQLADPHPAAELRLRTSCGGRGAPPPLEPLQAGKLRQFTAAHDSRQAQPVSEDPRTCTLSLPITFCSSSVRFS